jgi:NAD(P)-dependent dehydrogenase (short-subunit alcohol dehydrogenase family)
MSQQRLAVVTGASRGIGHEIARQLVKAGCEVLAGYRQLDAGTKAAAEIGARPIALDVTNLGSIERLAQSLPDGLDVVVNNAGVSLKSFEVSAVEQTLAVNFFGAMHVTDQLLPLLRPGARIVMVSSGMGELAGVSPELRARFSDPELTRAALIELTHAFVRAVRAGTHAADGWPSSAYRVSKMALNALTRILARELASDPRAIAVNAVCPGWVRTDMGGASAPRSPEKGAETPVWLALLPSGAPSGGFYRDKTLIPF